MKVIAVIISLAIISITGYLLLSMRSEPACDKPFIKQGSLCCLDQNGDGVCDENETKTVSVNYWQNIIDSVDNLTTKYNLNCPKGIKENVLYVVHVIRSQNHTECLKLKERIDVVKSNPSIFNNYLKIIDDCNSLTQEVIVRNIKGFSYGRLLPLKNTISNSDDFYYVYSGCVHEPDQEGGIFSFFEMAVDTESGITVGMLSR